MAEQKDIKHENDTHMPSKEPDGSLRRSKSFAELIKEREAKRIVKR